MATFGDFLPAILANPDEDAPRLVMADWLEETGDNNARLRAEFIRVQCRIAAVEATCSCGRCVKRRHGGGQHTNGPCAVDQERDELPDGRSRQAFLRRRERELHPQGDREDVAPARLLMPDLRDGGQPSCRWEYRRGLVDHVTCSADDWHGHGAAILKAHPVRDVDLNGKWGEFEYGPRSGRFLISGAGAVRAACRVHGGRLYLQRHGTFTTNTLDAPVTVLPAPRASVHGGPYGGD